MPNWLRPGATFGYQGQVTFDLRVGTSSIIPGTHSLRVTEAGTHFAIGTNEV